jgi:fido (protein-threonine AMPylation protein)
LTMIEKVWVKNLPQAPIATIHRFVFGKTVADGALRKSEFVLDFGGVPPTSPQQIAAALFELELQTERLLPALVGSATREKAVFLAHLFSSIIRVHPFEDGNGRVARFTVLLALRYWNLPYVMVPKVRNDKSWKEALELAIHGNIGNLTIEFLNKMSIAH